MPRDLSDVLHFFMPEAGPPAEDGGSVDCALRPAAPTHPAALPVVAVPIGDQDVVRAALTWNLLVEVARLGGSAALVAPSKDRGSPLWPSPGVGPMGAELFVTEASSADALYREALDVAVARSADAEEGGVVLVRLPPGWIRDAVDAGGLLRWVLLFTSSDRRDLLETYGIAKLLLRSSARTRVGVTVHGARGIQEAEGAFARLARTLQRRLGRDVSSYGLLVDDLDVYRAIVAQRPVGLAHPQSPAARALKDVARMLLDDARKMAVV